MSPPACGDAGTALGAAQHGQRGQRLTHTQLGPAYSDQYVFELLRTCGIRFTETADPAADAARLIAEGKVVAWFQGRMEFDPRALGAQSLLADPSTENMRTRVN